LAGFELFDFGVCNGHLRGARSQKEPAGKRGAELCISS
jgi:hypothetical protein